MSGNEYEREILERFGGVRLGDERKRVPLGMSEAQFFYRAEEVFGLAHEPTGVESWAFTARPNQLVPTWDWKYFHIDAARGWGKSRAANEWLLSRAIEERGDYALVLGSAPYLQTFMDVLRNRLEVREIDRYGWVAGAGYFEVAGSRIYVLRNDVQAIRGRQFNATVIDLDTADLRLYRDRQFWQEIALASRQIFLHGTDGVVPGWIRNSGGYVLRSSR